MNKRTAYQQQLDEIQLSEEKKQETLQLMLQENRRLSADAQKPAPSLKKRPSFYLAVAAACLALALISTQLFHSDGFVRISVKSLPATVSRGSEGKKVSFFEVFGFPPDSLFSSVWTVAREETRQVALSKGDAYQAELQLQKGQDTLSAVVTTFEPPLITVLSQKNGKGDGILLARDTDTGALYAAREKDGVYVVLSSDQMKDQDFKTAIDEVLNP